MAFGYKTTSGDFLPIVKYDARAGKMFKVDKTMGGESVATELPPGTKFALDLGSIEAGYVMFGPQGPVRQMKPYIEGETPLPQPQDKDAEGKYLFRPGFYAKIAGNAVDGVREWCSNAAVLLNAMDELYQASVKAPEYAAGKIPIVQISSTTPVKSGTGARSSTNYAPVFATAGWVDRPDQLGPRTVPLKAAVNGHAGYTPTPAPTQATAHAQSAVPPAAAMPF